MISSLSNLFFVSFNTFLSLAKIRGELRQLFLIFSLNWLRHEFIKLSKKSSSPNSALFIYFISIKLFLFSLLNFTRDIFVEHPPIDMIILYILNFCWK